MRGGYGGDWQPYWSCLSRDCAQVIRNSDGGKEEKDSLPVADHFLGLWGQQDWHVSWGEGVSQVAAGSVHTQQEMTHTVSECYTITRATIHSAE